MYYIVSLALLSVYCTYGMEKEKTQAVWQEFSGKSHTNTLEQLHAQYQYAPLAIDSLKHNQQITFATTLLPKEAYKRIFSYAFDENEDAYIKFINQSYAKALLDFAYVTQGAQSNPIYWLTPGDRYGASEELKNLYIKLNNAIKKQEAYPLSLRDEYILQTQMPAHVAQKIPNICTVCQLPYKKRIWTALKESVAYSAISSLETILGFAVLDSIGLSSQESRDSYNILKYAPLGIQHLCSSPLIWPLVAIEGGIQVLDRYVDKVSSSSAKDRAAFYSVAFIFATVNDHDTQYPSHNSLHLVSEILIGGTLGALSCFASTLNKMSKEYPIQKTIAQIKNLPQN